LLPWREAEEFGNLRRAFEEFKREAPYTTSNVTLFSAVAAHYIQDAHQPFHATDNYDGQQTGNAGIHSRFERDLIERYESRLKLTPAPVKPMGSARDSAFEALLASYLLVDPLLWRHDECSCGHDRQKTNLPALRTAATATAIAAAATATAAGTLLGLIHAQGTSAEVFSVEILDRARCVRA